MKIEDKQGTLSMGSDGDDPLPLTTSTMRIEFQKLL